MDTDMDTVIDTHIAPSAPHLVEQTLGSRIRQARMLRPMTQESLAIAAGVSVRTVIRVERGYPAAAETLLAVCAALNIPSYTGAYPDPDTNTDTDTDVEPDVDTDVDTGLEPARQAQQPVQQPVKKSIQTSMSPSMQPSMPQGGEAASITEAILPPTQGGGGAGGRVPRWARGIQHPIRGVPVWKHALGMCGVMGAMYLGWMITPSVVSAVHIVSGVSPDAQHDAVQLNAAQRFLLQATPALAVSDIARLFDTAPSGKIPPVYYDQGGVLAIGNAPGNHMVLGKTGWIFAPLETGTWTAGEMIADWKPMYSEGWALQWLHPYTPVAKISALPFDLKGVSASSVWMTLGAMPAADCHGIIEHLSSSLAPRIWVSSSTGADWTTLHWTPLDPLPSARSAMPCQEGGMLHVLVTRQPLSAPTTVAPPAPTITSSIPSSGDI